MLLNNPSRDHSNRTWPQLSAEERLHRWITKTITNNASMWSGDHTTRMCLSQKLATALGLESTEVVLVLNGKLKLESAERDEPLAVLPRNQDMIHPYKRRDYQSATQSNQE